MHVTFTYNQREASQPAIFRIFNISPKWTLNWLSYIQDDPQEKARNVVRYMAGGGSVTYTRSDPYTDEFERESRDGSLLVQTSSETYDVACPTDHSRFSVILTKLRVIRD